MNVVGKVSLGLVAAVAFSPVAWAVADKQVGGDAAAANSDAAAASQPYATIVARNVFGLVPIPPPPPPPPPQTDPPPKITANGITSIFGQLQALFKVDNAAKPGQPDKVDTYMLSEGERQDDIEVTKIDEKTATITFNNHGVIQEIPLTAGEASSGSAPAAGPGGAPANPFAPGGIPRFPRNRPGGFPGGRPGGFGGGFNGGGASAGGQNNGSPFGNNNNNANPSGLPFSNGSGNSGNGSPSVSEIAQQNMAGMTPEQAALLTEVNRVQTQDQVDKGLMPPLPATAATPADATGQNGEPLIQSPVDPSTTSTVGRH